MRQTRVFAPRRPSTVCSHLTVAHALSVPCRHSCRHVLAATDEKSGLRIPRNRRIRAGDQDIQGFGDRFGGGVPVVSMRSRTNRKLHAAALLPHVRGDALGWIPRAKRNATDRLPGMWPPEVAADVIARAVGVDP